MNCIICGAELEQEERWDGSITFSCPLCKKEKSKSTKAPREESIPMPGGRSMAVGHGYTRMKIIGWDKSQEDA